jgi:hypothetical protein
LPGFGDVDPNMNRGMLLLDLRDSPAAAEIEIRKNERIGSRSRRF